MIWQFSAPIKVKGIMCKWPNINETVDMAEVGRKEFHGHDRGLKFFECMFLNRMRSHFLWVF